MQPYTTTSSTTKTPCDYIHHFYASLNHPSVPPKYIPVQTTQEGEIVVPTTHGNVAVSCQSSASWLGSMKHHVIVKSAEREKNTTAPTTTNLQLHYHLNPLLFQAFPFVANLPPFVWTSFEPDAKGNHWRRNVSVWVLTQSLVALPRPRRVDEPMVDAAAASNTNTDNNTSTYRGFLWKNCGSYKQFISKHLPGLLPPFV